MAVVSKAATLHKGLHMYWLLSDMHSGTSLTPHPACVCVVP